jgi:hypothetical protein
MAKEIFTIDQVADALRINKGFVSQAAKLLKCDQQTIRNYMNRYPKLKQILHDSREEMLDFAENSLLNQIKEGNTVATLFYLKTQGKHRGYSEKEQITIKNDFTNFQIPKNINNLTYIENNSEHTQ